MELALERAKKNNDLAMHVNCLKIEPSVVGVSLDNPDWFHGKVCESAGLHRLRSPGVKSAGLG